MEPAPPLGWAYSNLRIVMKHQNAGGKSETKFQGQVSRFVQKLPSDCASDRAMGLRCCELVIGVLANQTGDAVLSRVQLRASQFFLVFWTILPKRVGLKLHRYHTRGITRKSLNDFYFFFVKWTSVNSVIKVSIIRKYYYMWNSDC